MTPDTTPFSSDTQPIEIDPLDVLLARAAPPRSDTGAIFARMATDARREARRGKRRVARVAAGLGLAAVLTGSAGAALAGGLFSWTGWEEQPDIAYAFTLPSGRSCEERIVVDAAPSAGDGRPTPSAAGAALRDWVRSADFAHLIDVPAALDRLDSTDGLRRAAPDARVIPDPGGPDALMVVLTRSGQGLDVVPKTPAGPTPDDLYANAVDSSVNDLLVAKAAELGAQDWATSARLQCEPAS